MVKVLLGAIALGAVGYGVKRCLDCEECVENIKDKIQDGAFKVYEGLEKIEEKFGLNTYEFSAKNGSM